MNNDTASSQFTTKRLFWMLFVAALTFKLADLTGVFTVVSNYWTLSQGTSRGVIFIMLLLLGLIAAVYIVWFSIRLPWLIQRFRTIRHKRQLRQRRLGEQYEKLRTQKETR